MLIHKIMLHKIYFFFLFSILFSFPLLAEDNIKFASVAYELIGHNRSVFHCELQQKQIVIIQTSDSKELKLLCVWVPQTTEDEYMLDETSLSLLKEVDKALIGYGQTAGNPMFYYCIPKKKASKKVKMDKLKKYKLPLSLYNFQF